MYWSLHDNNILCSFVGHTDSITHLDLNPLNSTFVSCSKDGSTRVWDYEKKQCLIRINKTKAACFDNTGNVLACVYLKDDKSNSSNDQGSA
jgi:WD40 repeat protein